MATYKGYQMDDDGNMLLPIGADVAPVELTSKASKSYTKGEYLFYNNNFYKVTSAIASGGTITPGSNCTATTVGAELKNATVNISATYLGCHSVGSTKSYDVSAYDWISIVYNVSSSMPGQASNSGCLSYPKDIWKQINQWHTNGQKITCTDSTLSFTTTTTGSWYIHVYGVKFK